MKGQDPFITSSSRRESSPAPEKMRAKSIGCMSGIFQFVYKYHNRRRSLTFGKKQGKNEVTSSRTEPKPKPKEKPINSSLQPSSCSSTSSSSSLHHQENKDLLRFSCEVPRSPTLPAEIRRSKSSNSSENFRAPPALVARLMGLNDVPPMPAEMAVDEKRRRLLGALEKCDEDLQALKKIIEVVKSSVAGGNDNVTTDGDAGHYHDRHLLSQPSPVSVLDEFTCSAFSGNSKRYAMNGRVPQQQKKKPGEEDMINMCFFDRIMNNDRIGGKNENAVSPLWTSKAMADSVNEVCKDIAWGERREIGRIGLALQDYICRDLIEEIVKEMGFDFFCPLPFESCKKRLRF